MLTAMRAGSKLLPLLFVAAACSSAESPWAGTVDCASAMPAEYEDIIFTRSSGSSTLSVNKDCRAFVVGSKEQQQTLRNAWASSRYKGDVRPLQVKMRGGLVISEAERENISYRISELLSVTADVEQHKVRAKAIERFGETPLTAFAAER